MFSVVRTWLAPVTKAQPSQISKLGFDLFPWSRWVSFQFNTKELLFSNVLWKLNYTVMHIALRKMHDIRVGLKIHIK